MSEQDDPFEAEIQEESQEQEMVATQQPPQFHTAFRDSQQTRIRPPAQNMVQEEITKKAKVLVPAESYYTQVQHRQQQPNTSQMLAQSVARESLKSLSGREILDEALQQPECSDWQIEVIRTYPVMIGGKKAEGRLVRTTPKQYDLLESFIAESFGSGHYRCVLINRQGNYVPNRKAVLINIDDSSLPPKISAGVPSPAEIEVKEAENKASEEEIESDRAIREAQADERVQRAEMRRMEMMIRKMGMTKTMVDLQKSMVNGEQTGKQEEIKAIIDMIRQESERSRQEAERIRREADEKLNMLAQSISKSQEQTNNVLMALINKPQPVQDTGLKDIIGIIQGQSAQTVNAITSLIPALTQKPDNSQNIMDMMRTVVELPLKVAASTERQDRKTNELLLTHVLSKNAEGDSVEKLVKLMRQVKEIEGEISNGQQMGGMGGGDEDGGGNWWQGMLKTAVGAAAGNPAIMEKILSVLDRQQPAQQQQQQQLPPPPQQQQMRPPQQQLHGNHQLPIMNAPPPLIAPPMAPMFNQQPQGINSGPIITPPRFNGVPPQHGNTVPQNPAPENEVATEGLEGVGEELLREVAEIQEQRVETPEQAQAEQVVSAEQQAQENATAQVEQQMAEAIGERPELQPHVVEIITDEGEQRLRDAVSGAMNTLLTEIKDGIKIRTWQDEAYQMWPARFLEELFSKRDTPGDITTLIESKCDKQVWAEVNRLALTSDSDEYTRFYQSIATLIAEIVKDKAAA
jgi:hypothetical protein